MLTGLVCVCCGCGNQTTRMPCIKRVCCRPRRTRHLAELYFRVGARLLLPADGPGLWLSVASLQNYHDMKHEVLDCIHPRGEAVLTMHLLLSCVRSCCCQDQENSSNSDGTDNYLHLSSSRLAAEVSDVLSKLSPVGCNSAYFCLTLSSASKQNPESVTQVGRRRGC